MVPASDPVAASAAAQTAMSDVMGNPLCALNVDGAGAFPRLAASAPRLAAGGASGNGVGACGKAGCPGGPNLARNASIGPDGALMVPTRSTAASACPALSAHAARAILNRTYP